MESNKLDQKGAIKEDENEKSDELYKFSIDEFCIHNQYDMSSLHNIYCSKLLLNELKIKDDIIIRDLTMNKHIFKFNDINFTIFIKDPKIMSEILFYNNDYFIIYNKFKVIAFKTIIQEQIKLPLKNQKFGLSYISVNDKNKEIYLEIGINQEQRNVTSLQLSFYL